MKNILVPVGNSPDSYETLQYAVQFAAEFGAMVYVMEVLNLSSRAGDLANVKEKAVETAEIDRQKTIELAEQDKAIAIAKTDHLFAD